MSHPPTDERDAKLAAFSAALATKHTWSIAGKRFGVIQLAAGRATRYYDHRDTNRFGQLINHEVCFRSPQRPYRPVALLTYSYNTNKDDHITLAKAHGLVIEFMRTSTYGFGTLAALYMRL